MNPETATLRSTDLCALLGVSDQSLFRWLAHPYPEHIFSERAPRGRTYALPEIVTRLRERRGRGLFGNDLSRVVTFDASVRQSRGADVLWLGDDAKGRAASFFAALTGEEAERARACCREVHSAAIASGLPGADWLSHAALLHPAVARFVLVGDPAEVPLGSKGWQSFAKALWAVNPAPINHEVAA